MPPRPYVTMLLAGCALLSALGIHATSGAAIAGQTHLTFKQTNQPEPVEPLRNDPGIQELIRGNYEKRYARWKRAYLATDAGRCQWNEYASDPHFTLIITVSHERPHGAQSGNYLWDAAGHLIGATITLGDQLNSGYPGSADYPIMCSLAPGDLPRGLDGNILAAAKLAHEFGHVNRTRNMQGARYLAQRELIAKYNKRFVANGGRIDDPQLLSLAAAMGGTPVSIQRDREWSAEANTMRFLQEVLMHVKLESSMRKKIRKAIDSFGLEYRSALSLDGQH
ncbi:MAG TPA: hypothetical protein VJX67_25605 [Blastocatellia bacterium]|nr:hypothetical protein [Blastocatellia bacterium]